MTETTTIVKPITKSAVLAAARRRWGTKVSIVEDRFAPTPAERERRCEERRVLKERFYVVEAELKAIPRDYVATLRKAARFVVDVEAEEPSLSQLKAAVEVAETAADLIDERDENRKARERIYTHARRWRVRSLIDVAGMLVGSIHDEADTLAELLDKIEKRRD